MRPGYAARTALWLLVAAGVALLALWAAGPAAAASYQNDSAHYGFTAPAGWDQGNSTTGDVLFSGTPDQGVTPNIIASHGLDPTVQNSSAWVLNYVQVGFDDVNSSLNVTVVQAPRTFITSGGRLAGDFIYNFTVGGVVLRQRQIVFVSEYYSTVYAVIFTDKDSTFNTHGADWAQVVDSFHVDGEKVTHTPPPSNPQPSNSDDFLMIIAGAIAVAGAVMVAIAFVRIRRQSAAAPPAAPAAFPRAPPRSAAPPAPPRPSLGPAARSAPPRVERPQAPAAAPPAPARPSGMPVPGAVVEYSAPPQAPPSRPASLGRPAAPAPPSRAPDPPRARAPPAPSPAAPPAPAPAAARSPPAAARAPAAARPAMIRCPKCATQFPGPTTRPATVQCPKCGTKGVMK